MREWTKLETPTVACGLELSAGMLLKTETGDILLVGNLNTAGGICDDCVDMTVIVATSFIDPIEE